MVKAPLKNHHIHKWVLEVPFYKLAFLLYEKNLSKVYQL